MNWLRTLMIGRYGLDQLSIALLIAYLPLSFAVQFSGIRLLNLVTLAPLGWCYFRILSRNTVKRREENRRFLVWWYPIQTWVSRKIYRIKDHKIHCYFKCPHCKQTVRVPKGKGEIRIACPKCKMEFIKKT
jgi:uncharacterized C2H2 Zn-finger protein